MFKAKAKFSRFFIIAVICGIPLSYATEPVSGRYQTGIQQLVQPAAHAEKAGKIKIPYPTEYFLEYGFYPAAQKEGTIGVDEKSPLDSPKDNLFHINLAQKLRGTERIYLVYDLKGVEDHTQVSRSINDQLSVGGYLVRKNDQWTTQKELLHPGSIRQGDNIIRFSVPDSAKYAYAVRNLGLLIEAGTSDFYREAKIILQQPLNADSTQIYLKGMVLGRGYHRAKISIDQQVVDNLDGNFEAIVTIPESTDEKWSPKLQARFPDGSLYEQILEMPREKAFDYVYEKRAKTLTTRTVFHPLEETALRLAGAYLQIEPKALPQPTTLSITALRSEDLPALDPGMVNVTAEHEGYRFLPHGTRFQTAARIELAYDEKLIPNGKTAGDIQTYYFDEQTHSWVALTRDSVLEDTYKIASRTDHFTDMINAVIQVPESPETGAYTPTTIKDLKVADPAAAIVIMEAPAANPMGGATTVFPLKIPAGRQGIQPEFALRYNSEGGHSWVGLGWDLSFPAITIDTRWGVPRFNPDEETETYLINGKQLFPTAHRKDLVPRNTSGTKQFWRRVEGPFDRIIRHGTSPENYTWEVTTKNGVRYFYGGFPESGPAENSVLRAIDGSIAYWTLLEVRDLNGNAMTYHCEHVKHPGLPGGVVEGDQLYVDRITYTAHESETGKYEVLFTRDRKMPGFQDEDQRIDVDINARLRFKRVTADLLRRIEFRFDGQPIRSYELNYEEGAFYKTLLTNVTEKDAVGQDFNSHTFEYYDEVRNGSTYTPLNTPQSWDAGFDQVGADFKNPIGAFNGAASAISGTKSLDFDAGIAVTVGLADGNVIMKSNTLGGHFNFSQSDNEGTLMLIDINGDGLTDKVFSKGSRVFYRPNRSGPAGEPIFGEPQPISSINGSYFQEKSRTKSGGVEAHFGPVVTGFTGISINATESVTKVYFEDVNGDQLIDLVKNGRVFFNHIDSVSGNPVFTGLSADTPSPIGEDVGIDSTFATLDTLVEQRNIEENPLHDVVRMWEAPFAGRVRISGNVRLLPDDSQRRVEYETADGVRAAIQLEGGEIWADTIGAEEYGNNSFSVTRTIKKDERLFFRLQSRYDGAYDQVVWDPIIEYVNVPDSLKDAVNINQEPLYRYRASEDYLLSGPLSVTAPIKGIIRFAGTFRKPVTTDDVHLEIWQTVRDVIPTELTLVSADTFPADQEINTDYGFERAVQGGEEFWFRVTSRTNVAWSEVQWKPDIYYTESQDTAILTSNIFNAEDTLLRFYPAVDYWLYPDEVRSGPLWEKDISTLGSVDIAPNLTFDFPFLPAGISDTIDIIFSVKRESKPTAYRILKFFGDAILNLSSSIITLDEVTPGEQLLIEYHIADRRLANFLDLSEAKITYHYTTTVGLLENKTKTDANWPVAVHFAKSRDTDDNKHNIRDRATLLFGPMYRGWGQFIYNGNPGRDTLPIDRSLLKMDSDLKKDPGKDTSNAYSPAGSMFVMMIPFAEEGAWRGYDNLTYIKVDTVSSSRMGQDYPKQLSPFPQNGGTTITRAVHKRTESRSISKTAGVGAQFASLSGSKTNGSSKVTTDFIDINGDSYPDVVGFGMMQFTTAQGVLDPEAKMLQGFAYSSLSTNETEGITLGGTYVMSKNAGGAKQYDLKGVIIEVGGGKSSAGLSANYGEGDNSTAYNLSDINGDGLPDQILQGGLIALNMGYSFATPEPWGFSAVRKGGNESKGGGIGINLGNASIMVGAGLSLSNSSVEETLQDVNGDGLPDRLIKDNPLSVNLNTGQGFADIIPWTGAQSITEGSSTSESLNAAFTGCIIIPIVSLKICFNPSANVGQGASRENTGIRDINGDGFPDYLTSSSDSDLTVATSRIGRTNKLKSIQRPLGSTVEIGYQRIGNAYAMPNSIWALSEVEINDGFAGDGADRMLTTFEYENGSFDRHEREFFGFDTVRTRQHDTQNQDQVYRTHVQHFINDNYYEKGLLAGEFLEDANGRKFTETRNFYQLQDARSGEPLDDSFKRSDSGAAFPAMVRQEKYFYEGQQDPGKNTAINYRYDRLGNIIFYQDLGESTPADDLTANIEYHSYPNDHLVGIPQSIEVKGGNNGITFRRRETDIDENTGNVTQIRQYLENGDFSTHDFTYDTYGNIKSVTRPKNEDGQQLSFFYGYDEPTKTYTTEISDSYGYSSSATYDLRFGQLLSSTDMNGQEVLYEIDNLGRITQIQGPYEIANGIPYTIRHEYHPEADIPWASTQHFDPSHPENPIETTIFIDGLARELQVKKDAAIFAAKDLPDTEQMVVSGRVLFDAFGRSFSARYPVLEAKGNEAVFNPLADNIQATVTTYDVLDRPLSVTLPDNALTQYTYAFGTDRNGDPQFLTNVTDPNGNVKEQFTDVRGRQMAIRYYFDGGNDHIWTTFAYNAINELTEVTDHEGNTTFSEYDWLGRRTRRIHPDAGTTDYQYDLASNLTARITENLRQAGNDLAIEYLYDRERLSEIRYPLNPDNNVRYEYGDPGEDFFRAGRIRRQVDATGEQTFFYGRLGEVVKNIRQVVLENGQSRSFTTRWTYDTWNRVTSMVYPDLEILTYAYNVGGKLRSVQGSKRGFTYEYLTQIGYDKFEQKVFQAHGNGTETTYEYEDDRRRLSHMVASTAKGRPMMDNTYGYDKVTNILSIKNSAPLPELNQMGGASEFKYEYDDLYRLVRAEGTWNNRISAQRFGLQMEYNKLHDIVRKRQVHQRRLPPSVGWKTSNQTTYDLNYEYESNQPHAATQVGGRSYEYDGNGNMASRTDDVFYGQTRRLIWDEEDRLMLLDDDERRHVYTYDGDDTRVIKRKDIGQYVYINGELITQSENVGDYTVYVGPHLVINAAGYTKHFFIENQRITSKLGGGGPYGLGSNWGDWENWSYWEDWDNLANASDWDKIDEPYSPEDEVTGTDNWNDWGYGRELYEYFFHPDHLGSNSFMTDALGEVHQHLEYLPFGEIFVDEHRNIDRTSYLFNGKELDEETGLYYYGARYYEPQISRWLTVDPMAERYGGWSPYNYTLNNPVIYIDPDGNDIENPILGKVRASVNSALEQASHLALGFINAIINNNTLGLSPRVDPNDFGSNATAVQVGQTVGDVVSLVQGTIETTMGLSESGAGVLASSTGAGALVGVPMTIQGAALATHGTGVAAKAGSSIAQDLYMFSQSRNGSSSSNRPTYETNPAHLPGRRGSGRHKTREPSDAKSVFERAIQDSKGKWWGRNENGHLYRYSPDNTGKVHFSGSTNGPNAIKARHIPKEIREVFKIKK